MANRWGNSGNSDRLHFWGSKITVDSDWSHEIKRHLLLGRKVMTSLDSILKSRDITLPKRSIWSRYGFSSSHVWMWELDYKESWVPRNWCFWTVVLLEGCSPWGRWGSDTTERLHLDFSFSCIGEGNGNPLQCSCLENPRDGGAWWAAVHGVT